MTKEEAQKLTSFKRHCTCGGYAHSLNGRPASQPHMTWCPQHDEYAEWWQALHALPLPSSISHN